jgi:hypothetical protein
MGWETTFRAAEAAERREQREAQKQRRLLERRAKEHAKLSAMEQARLEVRTYENRLELLQSVHKEQGQVWDWSAVAAALPSPVPQRLSFHELRARQQACLASIRKVQEDELLITQARQKDELDYRQSLQNYAAETSSQAEIVALARRVLAGDPKAYTQALVELSPLGEISALGSAIYFTVHNSSLLEATLNVNGTQAIPDEVKSLTSTEKLSVKPMPKARFHELYQDYICSCMLRVAREVFALLPIETLLVTACADASDLTSCPFKEQPVLSAMIERTVLNGLDLNRLDPSDALEKFLHRGDFKASRKAGAFAPIIPLSPADIPRAKKETAANSGVLRAHVQRLRDELRGDLAKLPSGSPVPTT